MALKNRPHIGSSNRARHRTARVRAAVRAQQSQLDQVAVSVPTKRGDLVLTRRHLLIGGAGVAVIAGIGIGSSLVKKYVEESSDLEILSVPDSSVTSMADFEQADADEYLYLDAEYELPYGSLVWANGNMAACLIPGDTGSPLNQLGVLFLSSGYCPIVLSRAVGSGEGYEIYDVRGSSEGLIWTEVNILQGAWRVYCAKLDDDTLGDAILVEEGDSEWETPTLAAVGPYAYWQLLPSLSGSHTAEQSLLKKVRFGTTTSSIVYQSTGRMATAPTITPDGVVITPRANTEGMYYQLTVLRAADDSVIDTMVLPQSMRPLEVGFGVNGFDFSFDAIYNYGNGISNLGTYTPMTKRNPGPNASPYSEAPWFAFNRTPSSPTCWCDGLFIIKSTRVVCGVDMENSAYFTLDLHGGSPDYGDFLASMGVTDSVVTYTNIDDRPIDGERMHCTLVRVYYPF